MKKAANGTKVPQTHDERITQLSVAVIRELSKCTLQDALTVICGIGGHLIANLSEGRLSECKRHGESLGKSMTGAAYAKLMADTNKKNGKETKH